MSKCEEKQLFQGAPSTPCCDVPFVKILPSSQVGSGEVFSITEDPLTSPGAAEEDEDDEWQDVEISEEWGPQTPMTPLDNDEIDEDTIHPAQQQQRFAVAAVRSIIYHSPTLILVFSKFFHQI